MAFAHACQELDGFQRLQAAHQSDHGGQHPGLDTGQGLLAKEGAQAGVAGFVLLPGEAAELPLQPDGGAGHQGYPVPAGALVEQIADGDVVGAVEHQLVLWQQGIEQRLVGEGGVGFHL
ncbi:hypothetical protein D3C75_1031680 [compost metagenome]